MDEGYIKFSCKWIKSRPIPISRLSEINKWRDNLYGMGLIGAYAGGIGFGNISVRFRKNSFIITGSATGSLQKLDERHYTLVSGYDIAGNSVTCKGPVKASSESLSHAAVYERSPGANAVIHIHNLGAWSKLIGKVPTTRKEFSYGTPGMANDIRRLFAESDLPNEKIIVMGGHKEGIITFGKSLDEAGNILLGRLK